MLDFSTDPVCDVRATLSQNKCSACFQDSEGFGIARLLSQLGRQTSSLRSLCIYEIGFWWEIVGKKWNQSAGTIKYPPARSQEAYPAMSSVYLVERTVSNLGEDGVTVKHTLSSCAAISDIRQSALTESLYAINARILRPIPVAYVWQLIVSCRRSFDCDQQSWIQLSSNFQTILAFCMSSGGSAKV